MSQTPRTWRYGLLAAVALLVVFAYSARSTIGLRGQSCVGFVTFLTLVAAFSQNLRAVNKRTIICGILLQFGLAMLVLQVPAVGEFLGLVGKKVEKVLGCASEGSQFVFGNLAKYGDMKTVFNDPAHFPKATPDAPDNFLFPFAFIALPPIIFISGLFSVLYYYGILQFLVKIMAAVMGRLMRTSGAETLSVSANVFMGQTEAPLIVKPFVPKMTQSELLALMASGMAHVSGGMMAVYIFYTSGYFGGDSAKAAAAILITCVMACPCSLYLTKLLLPETETPETAEGATIVVENKFANVIDALSSGISDGLRLALNVAAMLIGFIALIAMLNWMLSGLKPLLLDAGLSAAALAWWPDNLTFQYLLGQLFQPAALLIGVPIEETDKVGQLLGIKLIANEHVAFLDMTKKPMFLDLSLRSKTLAVYALTGFANFSSVGIQLGGIGAIAEGRRHDLAKLGMRALFIGFTATLVNAAVAGMLLDL